MAKRGARYGAVWGNLFQSPSDFVALVYQAFGGIFARRIPA